MPGDTRPTPGTLLVTVSPDPAISSGITAEQTADGWAISFQRFLVSIGRVTLDGDDCNEYSDTTYTRILDAVQGPGQKMSEHFALGNCDFSFRVFPPPPDVQVGTGVSDTDTLFMLTPLDDGSASGGVSIYAEGQATRGSETKHFAWPYRWVADYENCRSSAQSASSAANGDAGVGGGSLGDAGLGDVGLGDVGLGDAGLGGVGLGTVAPIPAFDLANGDHATVDLLVAGAALFRDAPKVGARLRFDPFAAADSDSGNGDGEITLDELSQVPLTSLSALGNYEATPAGDLRRIAARLGNPPTLQDYLYTVAFPSVVHFDDQGSCDLQLRAGRRNPND